MEAVWSPFEVKESHITIGAKKWALNCVGKLDVEMEQKTITKSCEGVVVKRKTRGTGAGTGTLSLHIPYDLYIALYGMENSKLATGISGYGKESTHQSFIYTGVGKDEEGVEVLIAIPVAVVADGPKPSFENGAEEVAEVEIAFNVSPDENGFGMYLVPESELPQRLTKTTFLENFTSASMLASQG